MHLQDWETRLRPYLSQVKFLAEIPLSQAEHADLEEALGTFVKQHGLTEATRQLQSNYPASFVTYLAFKAAFNEDRSFWDKVAGVIGLETQQSLFQSVHHWGKTFKEIISNFQLPDFSSVSGREYITPIRLHGGIPAFSLPDFFKHILLPSLQDGRIAGLDDQAALSTLLKHYTVELFVDDIVRHFFQHGGEHARRFFHKCRYMARLALQGDPLPSAEQLGLRPYVLQAFETYLQNPPEPSQRRRLPRLFFQPYDPAFRLILPSQPLSLEEAGFFYLWRIRLIQDDAEILADEVKVRARRRGQEWQTDEAEYLINELAAHVQVSLIGQRQEEMVVLKRSLRLLPAEGGIPLLAFRYEDGAPRSVTPSLPAQTLWLFYPSDANLDFEGETREVERLHPFPPPWDTWQAKAFDLQKTRLIRLSRNGQDICPPIPVTAVYEPMLVGTEVHPQSLPVEEKPLFLGAPSLQLPLRDLQHPEAELKNWRLTLESRYAAQPGGKWEGTADRLPYHLEDGCALLDLSFWLGEKPIGTYHLLARGPARIEIELPFRTWHEVQIDGLRPYYLPGSQGAQEVRFQIRLPADCKVMPLSEEVSIESSPHGWQVQVEANAHQARLMLEHSHQPEAVRVPLSLSIPRLRWALRLDSSSILEWQSSPLRLPLAQLLQSHAPRLRIELPLMDKQTPLAALRLKTPGQSTPLQNTESLEITPSRRSLEFRLDGFFDTLRAHGEHSVFDFALELLDASRELLVELPVLRLTQELDVRVCHLEWVEGGNWRVHWYEPRPLRYRRLRLWSLWQPWAEPVEIPLPDDAPASDVTAEAGWWRADLPENVSLPPAWYQVQFIAAAPDDTPPLMNEPPPTAIRMELIYPKDRLAQIERELSVHPTRAFALHAEKACIFDSQNRKEERDQEIKWCLSHWSEASLLHLFGFQRWLAPRDPHTRQAFLIYMFRPEKLEKLQTHQRDFVQKYLSLLQEAKTLKPESVRLVLNLAHDARVILSALKALLQSDAEEARQIFWESLSQGRFSEADAAALLKDSPDFARHLLKNTPASPFRSRLLRELSRYLDWPEYWVKVGYYVLFDLGWGKLLSIRGAERENLFFPEQESPVLEVELLHLQGQKAEIDLTERRISLPGRSGINRCACDRFAAPGGKETETMWQRHLAICGQSRAAIWTIPTNSDLTSVPIYHVAAPENPLDTRSGA
jgi:hypothetical protein